jgi:hypothetical protein
MHRFLKLLLFLLIFWVAILSINSKGYASTTTKKIIIKGEFNNLNKESDKPTRGEFSVLTVGKNEYILRIKPISTLKTECIFEVREITSPQLTRGVKGSIVLRDGTCINVDKELSSYIFDESIKNFSILYQYNSDYSLFGKMYLLVKHNGKYATLNIYKIEVANE